MRRLDRRRRIGYAAASGVSACQGLGTAGAEKRGSFTAIVVILSLHGEAKCHSCYRAHNRTDCRGGDLSIFFHDVCIRSPEAALVRSPPCAGHRHAARVFARILRKPAFWRHTGAHTHRLNGGLFHGNRTPFGPQALSRPTWKKDTTARILTPRTRPASKTKKRPRCAVGRRFGPGRRAGRAVGQPRVFHHHYLSGARRGRKRRHDQARHVRRQSARGKRPQFQGPVGRGAAASLSVAADARAASPRRDQHLQPLVL